MADSFSTVLISAGVGGVAGSVFPAVKEAISFVVLGANSQIDTLKAEMQSQAGTFENRQSFRKEVTEHTQKLLELVKQGQQMFVAYRSGGSFNLMGVASLISDLQQTKAYLEPFDMKARLSPEAATHIAISIAFADQMLEMLRQMRINEFTDKELLFRDQGDGPAHLALMAKSLEMLAGTMSSLQLWAIVEKEEDAGGTRKVADSARQIQNLKRRRKLSIIFLAATAVAAVIIVAVLVHVQGASPSVVAK